MKREKIVTAPCVVAPANAARPADVHVTHGTHWRAQRNAAMTARFGFYYHVHEWTVPTLFGRLCKVVGR